MDSVLLKIRRGETPFYRQVRDIAHRVRSSTLPLPKFLHPLLRLMYRVHKSTWQGIRWSISYFYTEPLFRGRCESVGRGFRMWNLPTVVGHTRIYIGEGVNFFGAVGIWSGRQFDDPTLIIGNRVDIGHNVLFTVNKQIIIEDDVNVATGVRFADSDGHPRDAMARIADMPAPPEEIKPVRIKRYAWIGGNSFIMKGVTVGEGAIIGVNSVVVNDIPDYCVAMGNPARVVIKNINKTAATNAAATNSGRE